MKQTTILSILLLLSLTSQQLHAYDFNVNLSQVYYSYASYCGNLLNSKWDCYWCKYVPGFHWIGNFGSPSSGIFGYVGYSSVNRTIDIVFRGTDNIAGWIVDFTFIQVPYGGAQGAKVHKGFYNDYLSVKHTVLDYFRKAQTHCPSCHVYVTGHSLGAALATLGALDVRKETSLPVSLINFGSPRVGNHVFSNYVKSTLTHVTRNVSFIPP
eukprot:TRINITY_DN3289_c0_g1_i2.p1 TRINITY_DN3289_c0_g1~~TRINITY_DN3289_c0_g1_i2.p1  ORF type:complete len:219 (+),score=35.07 TRINITY_DN3289_c0_g1_i2:26-658(+)